MSKTDPQSNKPNAPPAAEQQPKGTTKPTESAQPGAAPGKSTSNGWILGLLVAVMAVAAGMGVWILRSPTTPAPVASASEESHEADFDVVSEPVDEAATEIEEEPEPDVEAAKPASSPPATGTLVVRSDVEGADVLLNGKRVGKTPHEAKGLSPGSYDVKVEKSGYQPYQDKVKVAAKRQELVAKLMPASASLRVETNVSGARVVLDGEERGTTPVTIDDLSPGRHELTVSASGYKTHNETLDLAGGSRNVSVDLVSPLADLNEAVAVKHKHRIGSCEGVLRATATGLVYESEHKDAFTLDLSQVEQLDLDKDDLVLKVKGGRNYNFNERNDNEEALAGFHERVQKAIEAGKETP